MNFLNNIDALHAEARQNKWLALFSIFNRVALAAGFIPAGFVKIMGERFANGLSVIHPMGHYLEALHFTGYYYTFIGVMQVLAAVLLIIPRTVALGALIYFPIILNICILSFAVRFDGSLFTAPLMTLACFYLICWNYDRIKYLLPLKLSSLNKNLKELKATSWKFPFRFFLGVLLTIIIVIGLVIGMNNYAIMPRNTIKACNNQFEKSTPDSNAFCDCIHLEGGSLNKCLEKYKASTSR